MDQRNIDAVMAMCREHIAGEPSLVIVMEDGGGGARSFNRGTGFDEPLAALERELASAIEIRTDASRGITTRDDWRSGFARSRPNDTMTWIIDIIRIDRSRVRCQLHINAE